MKYVYPVILTPDAPGFSVYVPDFNADTQGNSLTEAIEMARDLIGIVGIDLEDDGKEFPSPSSPYDIETTGSQLLSLVDVDFDEYRRKHNQRSVRKNCTIPYWLCYEAEKAKINFSKVLQNALKQELMKI